MALATQDMVQALLLRDLTTQEAVYFPVLADAADAAIAAAAPGVAFVAGEDTVTVATTSGEAWLPFRPIEDIESAAVDGEAIPADAISWTRWGRFTTSFPAADQAMVEVTYNYGFTSPPAAVAVIAAELVVARFSRPGGAVKSRSETVGPFTLNESYVDADGSGMFLSAAQRKVLSHYGRRSPVVVPVEGEQVRFGFRRDPRRNLPVTGP